MRLPACSLTFEFLIDAACILDVIFNFRTGFELNGWVVLDPVSVATRYLQTTLLPDAICAIPYQAPFSPPDTPSRRALYR